jgi:hypothetical protein
MKHLYLIFVLSVATAFYGQTPSFVWAKTAGGTLPEIQKGMAVDLSGNVYITGSFRSSSITFGATTFTSPGTTTHMYLAKYDAIGNVVWAKDAIGSSNEGYCITSDPSGNVYLAGVFNNTMSFGSFTVTSAGILDIFIAKLDPSGNVIWLKTAGGTTSEFPEAITLDNTGNIYLAGKYTSGMFTSGSFTVSNTNLFDMFVAKFDASGNTLWLKNASTSQNEGATAISCDVAGNIYVGGFFTESTFVLGTSTLTNVNAGFEDLFLAKYDASGNVIWAKSAGSSMYETVEAIVVNAAGVYITGDFAGPSIVFGTNTLTSAGSTDIFLVQYDSNGNVMFAKREGDTGDDYAECISADSFGNLYVGVGYKSTNISFGSYTYSNSGNRDMILVKYNATGSVLWSMAMTGPGDDNLHSIATVGSDVFIGGDYDGSSINLASTNFNNAGSNDIFLAKISTTTGMHEVTDGSLLLLYPNPTTGIIHLQSSSSNVLSFKLFNTLGEELFSTDQTALDLSQFRAGVYFIQVETENNTLTKKMIKE